MLLKKSLFLLLVVLFATSANGQSSRPPQSCLTFIEQNPIEVELFLQSKDPFSVDVIQQLIPFTNSTNLSVSLRALVDGSAAVDGMEPTDGFSSLRGVTELQGDIWELCAAKLYPTKFLNFISCFSDPIDSIPQRIQDCSIVDATTSSDGIIYDELRECYHSQGSQLLTDSQTQANAYLVNTSPTVLINGARCSDIDNLEACICGAAPAPVPPGTSGTASGVYGTGIVMDGSFTVDFPKQEQDYSWYFIFGGMFTVFGFTLCITGLIIAIRRRNQLRRNNNAVTLSELPALDEPQRPAQPSGHLPQRNVNIPQPVAYDPRSQYYDGQPVLFVPLNSVQQV